MSDSQEVLTAAAAPPAGLADNEAVPQGAVHAATDQRFSERLGHLLTHRTFHHVIFSLVRVFRSSRRTYI